MNASFHWLSVFLGQMLLLGCFAGGGLTAMAQDRAGCEDHPLITRYPGSVIGWCNEETYQTYDIALGPQTGYRQIDEWQQVAGKVTRLYYRLAGERTMTEVYRNYLQAVQKGGFRILAQGLHPQSNVAKDVGGQTWLHTAYAANPLPTSEGIDLFHGTSTAGGTGYFAARLERSSGNVYLTLMAYQHTQSEVLVQVDIIEEAQMEGEKVSVDADYMAQAIDRDGKVALYGLYFDHDQAALKARSKPALQEIAALLRQRSELRVYVVGHTDNTGRLGYNLELSQRRAQAVVDALVKEYGLARERLIAKGVGPLVPVQSNHQEAGRARNRRVELVQQ